MQVGTLTLTSLITTSGGHQVKQEKQQSLITDKKSITLQVAIKSLPNLHSIVLYILVHWRCGGLSQIVLNFKKINTEIIIKKLELSKIFQLKWLTLTKIMTMFSVN